jgi:hypothetical protein
MAQRGPQGHDGGMGRREALVRFRTDVGIRVDLEDIP